MRVYEFKKKKDTDVITLAIANYLFQNVTHLLSSPRRYCGPYGGHRSESARLRLS